MKIKFLCFFLIFSLNIYSHPHVFFDADINARIENNTLEGLEINLKLDELNTRLNKKVLKPDKNMNVEGDNIVFL